MSVSTAPRSGRVIKLKERLGCASAIASVNEIESEAVFSIIDSVPYFELGFFVSQSLHYPLSFPFRQAMKSCEREVCWFSLLCSDIENEVTYSSTDTLIYVFSSAFVIAQPFRPDCNVELQTTSLLTLVTMGTSPLKYSHELSINLSETVLKYC